MYNVLIDRLVYTYSLIVLDMYYQIIFVFLNLQALSFISPCTNQRQNTIHRRILRYIQHISMRPICVTSHPGIQGVIHYNTPYT